MDRRDVGLAGRLGLNRSTSSLLVAILFLGLGQELWAPFMPRFLEARTLEWLAGSTVLGFPPEAAAIVAVGLYGTWRDLQEAVSYWAGGWLGGRLGLRRALLLFSALPLLGYALLLAWQSPLAAFLALPFVTVYDSISSPAALNVVNTTLAERQRTLGVALQSLLRRVPRVLAYLAGGGLVAALGAVGGVEAGIALSIPLVALALVVQWRLLDASAKDAPAQGGGPPGLGLLRRFDPELKKLLLVDALARVAEGMPRELFLLFVVGLAASSADAEAATLGFAQLLALQSLVALATYIPVGLVLSRGGSRKPWIALTFLCFSLFPLAVPLLGTRWGFVGLALAYAIGGLRELGEPARKALITDLVPPDARTGAVGIYWGVRCLLTAPMPLLGAVLWVAWGPTAPFLVASLAGLLGAALCVLWARVR